MINRICFFTSHFDFPRQNYLDYCEKIFPQNVKMFLFCYDGSKGKFKTKRIKKAGYLPNKILTPFYLRKFCRKNHIDRIINLSGMGYIAGTMAFASLLTKTKAIFFCGGNPKIEPENIFFFASQFFISRFLIAAKDIRNKVKKYLFFSNKKVIYLPATIDTDHFIPKNKERIRKKLKLNKNDEIALYVGNIHQTKGSDLIFEVAENNPNKKFILIGRIMDERYNKKIKNIILIPPQNKEVLVDYYNSADVFLFPSQIEGFGLAPREAMACGTPAIVSDIESLRLIEPAIKVQREIKSIQEAMDNFFSWSDKNKIELSIKSRDFVIKECSQKNMKKAYLKYLLDF